MARTLPSTIVLRRGRLPSLLPPLSGEHLLAALTQREQQVIRLSYGLDEADGRTFTRKEIAALLGIVPGGVQRTLRRALRKLRTPQVQQARSATQSQVMQEKQARLAAEREVKRAVEEARLTEAEAYTRLKAQGIAITMLRLAQEAQVGTSIANTYLCARWGQYPNAWNAPLVNWLLAAS